MDHLINPLRQAIASRRQIKLGYGGTTRTVEPHEIREAGNGHLLLFASKVKHGPTPEIRSYRVDRIDSVEVTQMACAEPPR